MNEGRIQGSNDGTNFVTLWNISGVSEYKWYRVSINTDTAYRYLRYYTPNGGSLMWRNWNSIRGERLDRKKKKGGGKNRLLKKEIIKMKTRKKLLRFTKQITFSLCMSVSLLLMCALPATAADSDPYLPPGGAAWNKLKDLHDQ